MKLRTAIVAGTIVVMPAFVSAQSGGGVGSGATSGPMNRDQATVRVGLFMFNAEGRIGAAAMQSGDRLGADLSGTVYLTPCQGVGGANSGGKISSSATDIWKLSGSVLEFSPEQTTVQVGWQRTRKGGQDEASNPQWVTVTLKKGERTRLESIAIPAAGTCPARDASLEVGLFSLRQMFEASAVAGSSGEVAPGAAIHGTFNQNRTFTQFAFARGRTSEAPLLNAELWLVRSSVGRSDDVRHLRMPVGPFPLSYGFTPVSIPTSAGTLTVRIEGMLESGTAPTGESQFHFSTKRTTTFAPTTRAARDTAPVVEGSTKTTVAIPGPDEVLSFELPPLQTPDGVSVPDKLSVRVKLTPRPY